MPNKVKMDLVGLDGNAFSLMGAFKNEARRQGWTNEEIKAVLDKCMSGDYNHLLCTLADNTEPIDEEEEEGDDAYYSFTDDDEDDEKE